MSTPKYWMITNRNLLNDGFGQDRADLSFWLADTSPLDKFKKWQPANADDFKRELVKAADAFPAYESPEEHGNQKHVTIFVHGYNNNWQDAAKRYQSICKRLFEGESGLGICILFSWPSDGLPTNYLPDRADARETALDLADVLGEFYDWLLMKQISAAKDPKQACRAKTSIIAHSMGNYVLQKAMQSAWTRKNQPLLVSLVNQLVMVAADVDNDLFKGTEASDGSDGEAILNLTYRVTALYTGRDSVLGMSAGLKHFGKRRLGRSGLDQSDPNFPYPDNVWDMDCTKLIPANADNIHSAYFDSAKTLTLIRQVLAGEDRKVILNGFPQPG